MPRILVPAGAVYRSMSLAHSFQEAQERSGFHVTSRSGFAGLLGTGDKHLVKPSDCVLYSFMRWLVTCSHKGRHRRGSRKQSLVYSQVRERQTDTTHNEKAMWGERAKGGCATKRQGSQDRVRTHGLRDFIGGQGGVPMLKPRENFIGVFECY